MKVLKGRVTGMLTLNGTGGGLVQGVQVNAKMSGRYALTGRAAAPAARGALKFDVTSAGKRQTGAGQIKLNLSSLRGTCDRMTGKLVLAAATASASDQTLPLAFTARRVPGSGPRC
jgi:hypothetical protein